MRRAAWLLAALAACNEETPPPAGAPAPGAALRFVDVAAESGVVAPTWCGRPERPHLLESGGSGLALFDPDEDGDLDLFLVNGWRLAGREVVERGRDVYYANDGHGTFADQTERAGLGDDGWGQGVEVGDVNGDGHADVFVTNFGPDSLSLGQGDGRFGPAAHAPGSTAGRPARRCSTPRTTATSTSTSRATSRARSTTCSGPSPRSTEIGRAHV